MRPRQRASFDPGRRRFLRSAAGGAAAVAVGGPALLAGCGSDGEAASQPADARTEQTRVPFHGRHQAGVLLRAPESGIVVAFNSQARDRAELVDAFEALSTEAQQLMDGVSPEQRSGAFPPTDSGVFGAELPPAELSIIVGVGASLFDERYGLASRKPRELVRMPFIANDRLDPALTHGDVSVTISAANADTTNYALRQLMRRTRGAFTLRWMLEGFNTLQRDFEQPESGQGDFGAGFAPGRNLLGFKDGTANPDATDDELMQQLVWVDRARDEPRWAEGGTYQAIRVIRMMVEFWDRTRLDEQEALIGRHKLSGAPLGGDHENDDFDFTGDDEGKRVPLDAHIRLANPRTPQTEKNRILRRGFSYSRGFDGAGRLDQGLLFSAFQASLNDGFLTVQNRLDGEPLEEYILPVGGGFFYVLPGVRAKGGFLGEGLLT